MANDAFKEEIINLHKERQDLIRAVYQLGLKPDVVPLPEQEQNVLRSLGLISQSVVPQDVKPEIKPKTSAVGRSTNQPTQETGHISQSEQGKNNLNQSEEFTDPSSQSEESGIKSDQSQKGKEARDQKEDTAVVTHGEGENILNDFEFQLTSLSEKNL